MTMSIYINEAWSELRERVRHCTKCGLCKTRHNTVFGEGPISSRCVIIGEAPGGDEDYEGRPFVGKAGQLLTDILEKGGGIPRGSVYIMNVLKCRPPNNRNPELEEILQCKEYLEAQLALLHPDIIVTMGNIATQTITGLNSGITSLRGKWFKHRGIRIFPMFHPSYLLRNSADVSEKGPKFLTWQDIKELKKALDNLQ